jgi:hypothetical protein
MNCHCQPAGSVALPSFMLGFPTILQVSALLVTAAALSRAADDGPAPAPPEAPILAADRFHWAYRPLQRSLPPAVERSEWCRTPIDRFILAELEQRGLSPVPEADRATLLRRVTFDLTGLPPTSAELDEFLSDPSPLAYERVVDRLLASRAYGERMAQAWLDLARYAETDGFEHDLIRPNAWRYRDWVINAFNADVPYDEFVRLQLAGDELRPGDPQAAVATGFLLCGPDMPDINLQEERRHNFLNSLTATVGSVFMGLQFECAACHDHKYDPISQYDFYRLRAFFESTDLFHEHPLRMPQDEAAETEFEAQKAQRWRELESQIAALRDGDPDQNAPRIAELEAELKEVKLSRGPPTPMGRVVTELDEPHSGYLWLRGDFRRRGPEVEPAFLRVINADGVDVPATNGERGSGGARTALAEWLTRPDHPLTTRVMVNRLWQHHFGRGVVSSSSDFGLMGDAPTHPELLDWLATELPLRGWSLKQVHRLMVTSSVYRTASRPAVHSGSSGSAKDWSLLADADPQNDLLGRMRRRRLEGEALRDAMLAASGRLNDASGGPGVRPPLPDEVVETLLKDQWPVSENAADHDRRSIYLFVRRNLRYPLFDAFDRPDPNLSCARRMESTTAPQALQLLNGQFARVCAYALTDVVRAECGDDAVAQVEAAYRRTLNRSPTAAELDRSLRFLSASTDGNGLADLCLVLFNLNEFLYVD